MPSKGTKQLEEPFVVSSSYVPKITVDRERGVKRKEAYPWSRGCRSSGASE